MNEFNHKNYTNTEAAWLAFRRKWLSENPPLDNGYYVCGICGGWVVQEEVTLDHIEPREAKNYFEPSNIQPSHGACNYRKGSKRWKPKVTGEMNSFLREMSEM